MRIKIESDVFDIIDRIKEIDDGYFLMYNTVRKVYELHNDKQINSYCLTIPFDEIDNKLIDLIHKTNIINIDNIICDIDNTNDKIAQNNIDNVKNLTSCMSKDVFQFSQNSSKNYDISKAFTAEWR